MRNATGNRTQHREANHPVIPDDYQRNTRQSPLTEPWEPLYWRQAADAIHFGLEIRLAHCNARGFAHGGLISSLADNAMGRSAVFLARRNVGSEQASAITVSLGLDFIGSAQQGEWVEFLPKVLKIGRTLAFVECQIASGDRLIARANATFRIL